MKGTEITRRDFLARTGCVFALGAGVAACDSGGSGMEDSSGGTNNPLPPAANSGVTVSGNVVTIDTAVGDGRNLLSPGGFLIIRAAPVIVINVAGSFRAFTSTCTHEGCTVSNFVGSQITCPCHGSAFNSDGSVAQGPAARALDSFNVSVSGGVVTVTT
ncbi:MAG: cytochrome b6-f complex iron-sulfur subunit [Rhodothermales bacterium]|jgi:cytochrome b6-f complex iron-sulfur subunit